ncbi:MAG: hypothetical protein M1830_000317 [Pleopsidium flavum]|nr:MAG: hypothetical protein M1830_000317 [Pleopsidium flavum]
MPHAQPAPSPGFQALILCGPGVSLNTFTSSPEEFPKALVPIANRPMLWYPLDWCYRMGVTNIQLITAQPSATAIEAALSQNPHLTSLPAPRADILAPDGLSQNTGTAEILRLPEVQAAITGDFIILPCDLICEIAGDPLLEAWMIQEGGLGGATGGTAEYQGPKMGLGGERGGRRGGLGVWYQTKGEGSVKGEETDFVATTPIEPPIVPPPGASLRANISNLVYSIPTDTLNDITEAKKSFPIRHSLIRKHGRIRMLTTYRDAHVYFFPFWVLEMIKRNEKMDSISEDVVGWWAKAGWQDGLGEKLGLREVFEAPEDKDGESGSHHSGLLEEEIDLRSMSTTWTSDLRNETKPQKSASLASRVQGAKMRDLQAPPTRRKLNVPPMLAYIHPTDPTAPLIRRVDTAALLLSVSLRLAKLESIEEVGRPASSPFAHAHKIAFPGGVAQRCTVTKADCLLAENVTVEEKSVIKESVIGVNCHIKSGARLTRCVLMDGAIVGEGCQLTGCILGRRSQIGGKSTLKDCEVQEGNMVPEETEAKNEKFMVFEGLDDDGDGGVVGEGLELDGGTELDA